MEYPALLAALERETAALAVAVSRDPMAPVPTCPGWDVAELGRHAGGAHRWALANITARQPDKPVRPAMAPPEDPAALPAWLVEGAAELARTVSTEPDAKVWTLGGPGVAAFWARRQAHETAMHRWDAETAVAATTGGPAPSPFDEPLALDGIEEAFAMVGFMLSRGKEPPAGSCHLHRTDGTGEWMLTVDPDGHLAVTHEHGKGDAAVRGSASDLLLYLWGRRPADQLEVFGDPAVAAAWGALAP